MGELKLNTEVNKKKLKIYIGMKRFRMITVIPYDR